MPQEALPQEHAQASSPRVLSLWPPVLVLLPVLAQLQGLSPPGPEPRVGALQREVVASEEQQEQQLAGDVPPLPLRPLLPSLPLQLLRPPLRHPQRHASACAPFPRHLRERNSNGSSSR